MKTNRLHLYLAAAVSNVLWRGVTLAEEVPTDLNIKSLSGTPPDAESIIPLITNTLLTVAGIISVIMIIVGGIMYSLSAGDSGKATKAKDTILYSVIGLVITMLAYAIVTFVTGLFA
jgi:uncharacterized membrane protein